MITVLRAVVVLVVPLVAWAQSNDLDTYALFAQTKVSVGTASVVNQGDAGSNGTLMIGAGGHVLPSVRLAADTVRVGGTAIVEGETFFNALQFPSSASILGTTHFGLALPVVTLPPPAVVTPGAGDVTVGRGQSGNVSAGSYRLVSVQPGATLVFLGGVYEIDQLHVRSSANAPSTVRCASAVGCTVRVRSRLTLTARSLGLTGGTLAFHFAGTPTVSVGTTGAQVQAIVEAPRAVVKLKSSRTAPSSFTGRFVAMRIAVGAGTTIARGTISTPGCGDGILGPGEDCDPPADGACPGTCLPDCQCPPPPQPIAKLHAVGPSVLHNASPFGVQLFGEDFEPGAQLEIADKSSGLPIVTLPTNWISSTEMTALVPAGLPVPSGIQRELTARVINPGSSPSQPPTIGRCQVDLPTSPVACTTDADCPPTARPCVTPIQRLTLFNDLAFLNPNSAAVAPAPHGLCDNGARCQAAAACVGIGSETCSPKLYVTPQQRDELLVFNTGTRTFVDQNTGLSGIQGVPVGDNPFHVEILDAGGGVSRAWVVNRFDDSISIIDTATDAEVARVTGAALGIPGRLRMETEIEFNRARTRAYLSNENTDEIQVLDVAGANRDAPALLATIDVGVNPRGMATNAADTRLYVANIQSADVSVVDIAPGSPTENQVLRTVGTRATDDIVGGRADGWEAFVISGRAPRGIVYSDAQDALFITSIGPQTGPRAGVSLTGGVIINPTVTVIDAATDTVVGHVALERTDPDRPSCSDPELMALDDARNRLYVTCQGSGTVDVLDTAALAAGLPAEQAIVSLPLPTDVVVPTLVLPPAVGGFGAKVCSAATTNSGAACTTAASCTGCPPLVDGIPAACCTTNNPIGIHNGPRGIAISADRNRLFVVNQFTTSIATLDVSPADPASITVTGTTSYPGAFGSNTEQRDRRLGQIDFFTDVRKTNVSCATCHIDDHQDGVFFEADVRGPRLRRVLSLRSTRDFPPLLQDQLVPDLAAFTDIVVHAERGGAVPCITCIELSGSFFCLGGEGTCDQTSVSENQQNTSYAKAVTFFPNPNLAADGSFSTTVPLPGGATGDARHGSEVFDLLGCTGCHAEPLFTIDQFRAFETTSLGQPLRMREVSTPVFIPLRAQCQDVNRPTGFDGSSGFSVPTLRGIWDTFPLLMSGAAGLGAVGPEPAFAPCTPGASGCCTQLASPLNPGGIAVPEQHLTVTTKDAIRAVLTSPLAVPGTGHGAALGLSPTDLNALIAYIRSL
jgi:YVTN family beta-propeller protein